LSNFSAENNVSYFWSIVRCFELRLSWHRADS